MQEGVFGVFVHTGGRTDTVGPWSAGCIAIYDGPSGGNYEKVMEPVFAHLQTEREIPVFVWHGSDFLRFLEIGSAMRPLLEFGSTGPWVKELQKALCKHGATIAVDGDMGLHTSQALSKLQERNGIPANGVCDAEVWRRLAA